MPKRRSHDEDAPRGALAATSGLLMRLVKRSPKDFAAGTVALAAICAIVGNAIFMQAGRHPSPMFGPPPAFSNAAAPSIPNPLPRPRTLETVQAGERALDSRLFDNKPQDTRTQAKPESRADIASESRPEKAEPRTADSMANLIRHAATPRPQPQARAQQVQAQPMQMQSMPQTAINSNVPRPPAAVPSSSRGDPVADLISRGR